LRSAPVLTATHTMIRNTRDGVAQGISAGLSLADIQKQGLDDAYESFAWAFISEAKWIETLYSDSLKSDETD